MVIEHQELPESLRLGDSLEVVIHEIISPSSFWINIRSSECSLALQVLMDDLQEYYNERSTLMIMPPICIRQGQIAAALFDNEWHRVEILSIDHNECTVRVFYFDFGTISQVSASEICFLSTKFASLNRQGILCRLAQITIPTGHDSWPIETSRRFKELIYNKPLVAILSDINREERSLSALLVDTTTKKDKVINNLLVEEGLALSMLGSSFEIYNKKNLKSSSSSSALNAEKKSEKNKIQQKEKVPTKVIFKEGEKSSNTNDKKVKVYESVEIKSISKEKIDSTNTSLTELSNISKNKEKNEMKGDDSTYYNFKGDFLKRKLTSQSHNSSSIQNENDTLEYAHLSENSNSSIYKTNMFKIKEDENIGFENDTDMNKLVPSFNTLVLKENSEEDEFLKEKTHSQNTVRPPPGFAKDSNIYSETVDQLITLLAHEQNYHTRTTEYFFNQLKHKYQEQTTLDWIQREEEEEEKEEEIKSPLPALTASNESYEEIPSLPDAESFKSSEILANSAYSLIINKTPSKATVSTIRVNKRLLHRIIIGIETYLVTTEILYAFTNIKSLTELLMILMNSKKSIPFYEFNRQQEPDIFYELDKFSIIYNKDGYNVDSINLVSIHFVSKLMNQIGVENPFVLKDLQL